MVQSHSGSQLGVVTEKLGVVTKFNVVRTFLTTLSFMHMQRIYKPKYLF